MSSILGITKQDKTSPKKILRNLNKRGKDYESYYRDSLISLYMTQLSPYDNPFLDIKMPYETKEVVIFIDGVLNNKYHILEALERSNIQIKTDSDAEVIEKLYKMKGLNFLEDIDGQYLIIIYDKKKKKLYAIKDIYGTKQLYYATLDSNIIFANRMEYLMPYMKDKKVDLEVVDLYFTLGFIPSPYTLIKGIRKLRCGEILEIDLKTKKYKLKETNLSLSSNPIRTIKEGVKKIEKDLSFNVKNAIENYDEGLFFSGDIETTAILDKMSNFMPYGEMHAFNILTEDDKQISKKIKKMSSKYDVTLHQYFLMYKEIKGLLRELTEVLDEPFSNIDTLFLLKLHKKSVKYTDSILTGFGGKEIFGNKKFIHHYRIYEKMMKNQLLRKVLLSLLSIFNPKPFTGLWYFKEISKIKSSKLHQFAEEYFKNDKFISHTYKQYIKEKAKNLPPLKDKSNKIILFYYYTHVADNETAYLDKISQFYGIELRHPFLAKNMLKTSFSLPLHKKVGIFRKNKILRTYAKKKLPRDAIYIDTYDFKYYFELNKVIKRFVSETQHNVEKMYKRGIISKNIYSFYKEKVFTKKSVFWENYIIRAHIFYNIVRKYTDI